MRLISKFLIVTGLILLVNVSWGQSSIHHGEEVTFYGPVKSGEILWTIASRFPFDKSLSRYQIMLAVLQANPHAFKYPCNLNSLNIGATLRIPPLATVRAIDRTFAIQEVTKQVNQWYNRKVEPVNCSQPLTPIASEIEQMPILEQEKSEEKISADLPSLTIVPDIDSDSTENSSEKLLLEQDVAKQPEQKMTEKVTENNPDLPQLAITPNVEPNSEKDEFAKHYFIISLVGAIVVGIIVGVTIIWQLPTDQQNTDEKIDNSEVGETIEQDVKTGQYVTVMVEKKHFEEWQFIQKYSEGYRFHPLAEALIIGIVTFTAIFLTSYFIFYHALEAQKDEIREGLVRTAQAMITTIDTESHQTFTHKEQESTEVYQNAIKPFARLLELNTQIQFVYTAILKEDKIYFILDPTPAGDADGDGVEDSVDIMQEYDDPSGLLGKALRTQQVIVTKEPITDQWGSYFGAYVPFHDKESRFIGILGMDIKAENYYKRLAPIKRATVRAMVAGCFIAFIVGSLVWFTRHFSTAINRNRSQILKELLNARTIQSSKIL